MGIKKRIKNLLHHTFFFDGDIKRHLAEIYDNPQWPTAPQFYVCCASKTDPGIAPEGCENVFILIPVATGLEDTDALRNKYFEMVIKRMEKLTGESITPHIVFRRNYSNSDFIRDYNAFKGNAYGLAITLMQTANFRPGIDSRRINNLFFTGQLTVPGPGVPPSIISGQLTADTLVKTFNKNNNTRHSQENGVR